MHPDLKLSDFLTAVGQPIMYITKAGVVGSGTLIWLRHGDQSHRGVRLWSASCRRRYRGVRDQSGREHPPSRLIPHASLTSAGATTI